MDCMVTNQAHYNVWVIYRKSIFLYNTLIRLKHFWSQVAEFFEKGEGKVEVLLSPEESRDPRIVKEKLEKAIEKTVLSKGKSKDYSIDNERAAPLQKQPVLSAQIKTSDKANN